MKGVHLAGPADAPKLLPLVAAFLTETSRDAEDAVIENGITPLLEGSPHGAIWLIGPRIAPVGYVCISFGWSLGLGGMTGHLDAFYIRKAVRGRGMGTEAMHGLVKALQGSGLKSLSMITDTQNDAALSLARRSGFEPRGGHAVLGRDL